MILQTPANEAEILPGLPKRWQDEYTALKKKAAKAAEKLDDSKALTGFLSIQLDEFKQTSAVQADATLDPSAKKTKIIQLQQLSSARLNEEFPRYPRSQDAETVATAKRNKEALEALGSEVHGDTLIGSASKWAYDKDNGGVQWSHILGAVGFGAAGLFMGRYIAEAAGAGAGWLGTIAILLLTVTAAVFGGNLMHGLFNPAKENENAQGHGISPEKSAGGPAQAHAQACGVASAHKEYSYKPKVNIYDPGNHRHFLKLVQNGNEPPSLTHGQPQMTLDGEYIKGKDGTLSFRLANAQIHTNKGKPLTYSAEGITLATDKDGTIHFDSPENIKAMNNLDEKVKAQNNQMLDKILNDERNRESSEGKRAIALYETVSEAKILNPSVLPAPKQAAPQAASVPPLAATATSLAPAKKTAINNTDEMIEAAKDNAAAIGFNYLTQPISHATLSSAALVLPKKKSEAADAPKR